MIRRLYAVLLAGIFVVLGAATAQAAVDPAQVAAALRSDPLYVAPDTGFRLSAAQAADLRNRLRGGSPPIYLALLPPAGSDQQLLSELQGIARQVGANAVYAASDGTRLVAGQPGSAYAGSPSRVAREVVAGRAPGDVTALTDFVDRIQGSGAGSAAVPAARAGGSSASFLLPLLVLVAAGAAVLFVVRRGRRARDQRSAAEFGQVRASAEEDVTKLGEDIAALDLDVADPRLAPAAVADYRGALDSYDRAKLALEQARQPDDLAAVSTALEEGRWQMARVRARLAGQALPERRPPCFFNPQHGPSATDVDWAPPGGAERRVPVCAADADRLARGEGPDARQVLVGGNRVPYWQAPPMWRPWAGGYYGGFGGVGAGLLGGLLLGGLLSPGPAYVENNYFGGDGGGGGDFGGGGGDWGGGDFGGGGDWGGGDFGGGN